jgi:nitronate monooxygenase
MNKSKSLLHHRVPLLSFTFSLPERSVIEQIRERGMRSAMMITTVNEAIQAEEAGINFLVAQGSDAGGHRGTYEIESNGQGELIGTMSLVPQVVDHVALPVVAAGGIMDGRGLVAALALGAQGAQLGTRFLLAEEADTHPVHRSALLRSTEQDTTITSAFSGRPARAIKNEYVREAANRALTPLPYPWQNEFTQRIRQIAAQQNDGRFMSLWSGQGLRMANKEQSAKEIIQEIIWQANNLLTAD